MDPKDTRWIVQLEEDPETGDLVMPFPPELLTELGWGVGDTLTWEVDNNTPTFKLTKKKD
jgi:hypothetical protein